MVQAPIKPPTQQLSDAEFRQFLQQDNSDNLYELIDGWLQIMAEPGGEHESIRSFLLIEFGIHVRQQGLSLEIHPMPICRLAKGEQRRPDLIVVDKAMWRRNTQSEAILEEPPELVVEVVSTNWEDDYIKKSRGYAAFGVKEYWIADLLLKVDQYTTRKIPTFMNPLYPLGRWLGGAIGGSASQASSRSRPGCFQRWS